MTASGDLLIHGDVSRRAARLARANAGASTGAVRAAGGTGSRGAGRTVGGYDFSPILAGTTHLVRSADLALCHVEVPLSPPGGAVSGYPRFAAPAQLADAVAEQGYDSCSTASNHSLDQGTAGVTSTLNALDAAGVRHAGTARSAAEAATPTILTVKGVKVAHLATTYGFNGLRRPRDKPWLASAIADDDLLAKATTARRAGAQVVVVSVHWGTEKQHEPDAQQRALAPKLLASPDIDLVIGHHAHVVQPLERIGGKWVAYGLGNLVAGAAHDYAGGATHEGILPRFTFREQPDGRFRVSAVEVFPTYVDKRSLRVLDASGAGASGDVRRARTARARTTSVVLSRGAGAAGVVVR